MDCVIPGHSVRSFCAAIVCLSKIGKELYFEFDPLDGLSVRALNDAKSAYCHFRYDPAFFERCTAPPAAATRKRPLAPPEEEARFSCRVALRALAAVVRPRRDVVSLRLFSDPEAAVLHLTFEFQIQKNRDALLRVVHRVKAADATSMTAVMSKEDGSELVASPRVFSQLMEPLKQTLEAAMIISKESQVVSVTSFHHCDNNNHSGTAPPRDRPDGAAATGGGNAVLLANAANLLKTETGMTCENFDEFFFRDGRPVDGDGALPRNVNQQVVLVFPIREFRAMVHFCAQAKLEEELRVSLHFHWGGRPMAVEAESREHYHFSAELVLATLDHTLLSPALTQNA